MIPQIAKRFPSLAKNTKMFAIGWSLWPPFIGAGIRVEHISSDFRAITVSLKQSMRNTNYVGTHFGGSLYAMTDPFFMIMFMKNLGPGFVVWDKASKIDFKKPGKGLVKVHFEITDQDLNLVKKQMNEHEKSSTLWHKEVEITNENGEVVAKVLKTLYFKKKV